MNVRAILLAAGKGTRMKSRRPKVLHELCGRPLLWYALNALRQAGVAEIFVVTSGELQASLGEFQQFNVRPVIQEPQNGTGHAVQVALAAMQPANGQVIIAYGDMPLVDEALYRAVLAGVDGRAAALVTARMPLPSNFGRIIRNGDAVDRIVEERDCTPEQRAIDEMNTGIYVFDESALRDAVGKLKNDNAQKEYYLTDAVEILNGSGKRVNAVQISDHSSVMGINDRVELARAREELNRRLCEQHMRDGVTIIDPRSTYLEPELAIGNDTIIYPNTTISRLSEIGISCVIGPNTRLSNAKVGDRSSIVQSVVTDCQIGSDCGIGPYAHLRNGAVLEDQVKIGNFVEVKGSRLARGVKASHLTYIGDAEIGEETNIGAGTITCNYDGVRKNKTTIGRNVFIGSNSSLIAPVNIGDGAVTGAGSVVTKDVPERARVAGNPARPLPEKSRA